MTANLRPVPVPTLARLLPLLLAGTALAAPAAAQVVPVRQEVFAGGEIETYLRVLQVVGEVPPYPWSARAFAPGEIDSLAPRSSRHPWANRYDFRRPAAEPHLTLSVVRPRLMLVANTAFPYGGNDGPVWAGRGLTTAVQAGVALRSGRVSLTIAPIAFRAENAAFDLLPNGQAGRLANADGQWPGTIDRPQRFGASPCTVLDLGQSTLRVEFGPVAVGASTANQAWGPADRDPLVLGTNAAGFPHLFLATTRPLDLWFARIHGRLVYARLGQSAYSSVTGPASRRIGAGYVAVLQPRGTHGLELGLTRFFHRQWPEGGPGWRDLWTPFQAILKADERAPHRFEDPDNQLISVFVRAVMPRSGLEVYGEFAREDNARDVRDLLSEPDHDVGFTIGFRKAWRTAAARVVAVRAEVMNTRITGLEHGDRGESVFYVHGATRQGHTHLGQVLGSADGVGGGASSVAVDLYSRQGRWSLTWRRALRAIRGGYPKWDAVRDGRGVDAVHALGLDGVLFCVGVDVAAGLTAMVDLNRDFRRDRVNLSAVLGLTVNVGAKPADGAR